MTLGIMQPYFFPYPGYFALIKATNKWIVFDTPQFVARSWMNRNRIIDPNKEGWVYFTVPVKKHPLKTPINLIETQNNINWKEKMIGQLVYYKKYAPYYSDVIDFLNELLRTEFNKLMDLNTHTLKYTCEYLNIDFNYEIFSEMNLILDPVNEADEWGLNICKAMGVKNFINPELGQKFVDRQKYIDNNINLKFFEFGYPIYNQKREGFIPGLSIIDAMMFNTSEEINQMLDVYKLV